jgi:hypothetical protein
MNEGFLTEAQLEFYTGRKQPAAQIRLLQKWKIRHIVNADGRPRVTWANVNGTEGGGNVIQKPKVGPKFEALAKAG